MCHDVQMEFSEAVEAKLHVSVIIILLFLKAVLLVSILFYNPTFVAFH
jgi:hypothetical protein